MRGPEYSAIYEVDFDNIERPLCIPMPQEFTLASGVLSTNRLAGPVSVRMSESDLSLVREEAHAVGMTPSSLMRWFILAGSRELRRQRHRM